MPSTLSTTELSRVNGYNIHFFTPNGRNITFQHISTDRKALYQGIDGAFSIGLAESLKARVSKPY